MPRAHPLEFCQRAVDLARLREQRFDRTPFFGPPQVRVTGSVFV